MATPNPVDTSSFNPQQMAAFNNANSLGTGVQTYNSTTQQPPASTTTINNQPPTPSVPSTPATQPTTPAGQPAGQLALPANQSIVDLLNSTGVNSSYENRSQLAQSFGIANYSGTAQQNIDFSKKYVDAFNAQKGTQAPQTGSEARSSIEQYLGSGQTQAQQQPLNSFYDAYGAMSPVENALYSQINQILSTPITTQSFTDEYKQLTAEQGIPGLQTELMNIQNIMDGTEADIRDEITNSGGFVTNSSVQALASARNKTLLKTANQLQQQLALKTDYVNQIMQLTQADRSEVEKQVDRKLGLTTQLVDLEQKMTNATRDNYKNLLEMSGGVKGLSDLFATDPAGRAKAEKYLSLPPGALSNQAWLDSQSRMSYSDLPAAAAEYEYAKSQGYAGSFSEYQNEDANRKKSIAAASVGGLSPNQINSTVNQIAGSFDNEPLVKEYNTIRRNIDTFDNLGTSATDDIQRVYTFAKVADPNSAVKEGEYASIEKYSQALLQRAGLKVSRVFAPTGILTPEARTAMRSTLQASLSSSQELYKSLESEYQRQINDAYAGKPRQITSYGDTVAALAAQKGFDLERARKDGVSEAEIADYLHSI